MTAAEFLAWTRDHATRGNAADDAAVAFAVNIVGPIAEPGECGNVCGCGDGSHVCRKPAGHRGSHRADGEGGMDGMQWFNADDR